MLGKSDHDRHTVTDYSDPPREIFFYIQTSKKILAVRRLAVLGLVLTIAVGSGCNNKT